MHLLATTSTSLDDIVEPVDLGQPPGEIASSRSPTAISPGLRRPGQSSAPRCRACGWRSCATCAIRCRSTCGSSASARHAKVIVVRLLGGLDWWRYGIERLSALARERGIALAVLPGEDRDDPRLADASTLPADELDALLRYLPRRRPRQSARACCAGLRATPAPRSNAREPRPVPRAGRLSAAAQALSISTASPTALPGEAPSFPIIFYRSHAACRRHRADRCAVRGAGRARACAGAAVRHQPEGRASRPLLARRACAA